MQSIPVGAAEFWVNRLNERGIEAQKTTRFGADRVTFTHPCGIPHELVENAADARPSIVNEAQGIGPQQGIKGIYGGAVSVLDRSAMDDFLTIALPMAKIADSHEGLVFAVPNAAGGPAQVLEVLHEPGVPQGTWTLAGGTIHHLALNTGDEANQLKRVQIEGLGFTDISEQKDRNYFKSCYVRSPGGALFEIAWTVPEGWAKDESADAIGSTLVFPPWFADRQAKMEAGLEPANF